MAGGLIKGLFAEKEQVEGFICLPRELILNQNFGHQDFEWICPLNSQSAHQLYFSNNAA